MHRKSCGILFIALFCFAFSIAPPALYDDIEWPMDYTRLETFQPEFDEWKSFEDFWNKCPISGDELNHHTSGKAASASNEQAIHMDTGLPSPPVIDNDSNVRKRRRMDDNSKETQKHLQIETNISLEMMDHLHHYFEESATAEAQEKVSQKSVPPETIELFAESDSTSECVRLATSFFRKKNHDEKVDSFEKMFVQIKKEVSSRSTGALMRRDAKVFVDGFPMAIVKISGNSSGVVRLLEYLENDKIQCKKITIFKPRIMWLFTTVDFFHHFAARHVLGELGIIVKEAFHYQLLQWLKTLIFYQTQHSLPLIGFTTIEEIPKNSGNLFGTPQKYMPLFLTDEIMSDEKVSQTAISLLGYWYKIHKSTKLDFNFENEFWRNMTAELEKTKHVVPEISRRIMFWSGRPSGYVTRAKTKKK